MYQTLFHLYFHQTVLLKEYKLGEAKASKLAKQRRMKASYFSSAAQ